TGSLLNHSRLAAVLLLVMAAGAQSARARLEDRFEWRLYSPRQDVTAQSLKPGEKLTRQIDGVQTLSFPITLAARDYAAFRVEQHNIILLVTLFDPENKPVIQMDNPAGGYGSIVFSTIAAVSGTYRVDVAARDKWTNPSKFDITVDEWRGSKPDDRRLVDAQQAFVEGRRNVRDNNFVAALPFFEHSLLFWQETKNARWQALTHFARAQAYAGIARERPNAIKELEAALHILKEEMAPNDWRLKASSQNDLGAHYAAAGEIDRGINLLNQAFTLYSQYQDRRGQASSLNLQAMAYARLGNYSRALELVEKAIPLRYAENDLPGATALMSGLGFIADRLGETEKALEHLSKAWREWEKLGDLSADDRRRVAILLNNLAAVNDKLGHWEQARDLYDKALSILGEGEARVATLDNKGEMYASLGDVKRARECYEEALRLLPPEKFDADLKAGILVHLGQVFSMEGNLSAAVSAFEEARALKPPPRRLADVLTNLGVALAAQGKLDAAVDAYEKALAIQEESKDVRGQALTLQRRGEANDLLKKPQALDDLNKALELWRSVKDIRGIAATLNALARAEQGRTNLVAALRYSNEAIDVVESQRLTVASRELRTAYFATQENYYVLNVQLNMQLNKTTGNTDYLARAFEMNEKSRARVLLEALKEIGVGTAGDGQTSNKRLAQVLEQRSTLMNKLAAKAEARTKLLNTNRNAIQLTALDKEIDALTEKSDTLDTEIRSLSPRFASLARPQPANLKEIQQQLDDDTLLLEYSLGARQSYAWTVTTDSIRGFELPGQKEIENAATRLGEAINSRNLPAKNETAPQRQARENQADKDYAEAARNLSRLVVTPVASEFRKIRVVLVPDGALQNVSFASLPTIGVEADIDVIAKHEIVVLPSASVIGLLREQIASRKPAPPGIIVMANPVFNADDFRVKRLASSRSAKRFNAPVSQAPELSQSRARSVALENIGITKIPELPFSLREAQRILQVAPKGQGVALLNFDANRSRALSPEMARFRFIHFATHGVVDLERPALSRIILSLVDENGRAQDGYLFLHDIYNLNLPVELVVLSACQTGIGKQVRGEGLIALTRGFMYAGAARLVASYWDVDDVATAELMAEFYRELFTNNKRPAEALQAAQLHIRKQKRWESPSFWAGFFIQGEWR
ncbi:MAG TPA: CHAT domain-containing protein, partial [Pyrinomonadaceae bacterium]|nr:CHAT domain-containing protein [Pyrinomonadaceae bacterium]